MDDDRIERDRAVARRWGLTLDGLAAIRLLTRDGGAAQRHYSRERRDALLWGVGWQLSFGQWWSCWTAAGLWGCRHACRLDRIDKTKPFRADNIRIRIRRGRSPQVIAVVLKQLLTEGRITIPRGGYVIRQLPDGTISVRRPP